MIQVENISVCYPNRIALKDVSFQIEKPSIVGILGPNGAGKSTLIKALLGMLPHQGQAFLDQKELSNSLHQVAYVEQKAAIDFHFPITVAECVSLGLYAKISFFKRLSKKDWKKVDQALELVGLSDYAKHQISQLSGGQFQRVLLARCLVQEANVIFLDEPFVGIDTVSEEIIMKTLRKLKENKKTILIVHHDLNKVETYFDKVLLLNQTVIAMGDTKATFTRDNLKKTYGQELFFKEDLL